MMDMREATLRQEIQKLANKETTIHGISWRIGDYFEEAFAAIDHAIARMEAEPVTGICKKCGQPKDTASMLCPDRPGDWHEYALAQESKVPEGWRKLLMDCRQYLECGIETPHELEADHSKEARQLVSLIDDLLSAAPPEPQWNNLKDKYPKLGQRVILKIGGVVQRYTPKLDSSDDEDFWDFEGFMDHGIPVDFERDQWMPVPAPGDN